jgi:superfamily II DNA or RNA helicase
MQRLQMPNPKFTEAQNAGRSVYGIQANILNFSVMPDGSLLVPRGCRKSVISLAESFGQDFEIKDERQLFPHLALDSSKIKYRPYQFDAVIKLFSEHNEAILVAPAGSGKTVMGLSMIPLSGQPTLWLTHTGPLAKQAKERAEFFLPDIGEIGKIGGGKWIDGEVLTIGMIQTLIRNPEKLIRYRNKYGMVILDEAHHCPATTFLQVISHLNPYYLFGLTATPKRRDKLERLMYQTIGEESVVITQAEVESHGGIMVPTIKYRAVPGPSVQGNNIQTILKKHIVGNVARNRLIAGDVLAEAVRGHYCIVISDRKQHCEDLYDLLQAAWPKTGIATGNYSKKYVEEQVQRFNDNEITVLVATYALLGEGFDVPFLDRAFVAMPFRAENKAEQLIGRVQRTHPGKKYAVVYDYVDANIGVLANQFFNKNRDCRYNVYVRLGANVEPI